MLSRGTYDLNQLKKKNGIKCFYSNCIYLVRIMYKIAFMLIYSDTRIKANQMGMFMHSFNRV